MTASSSNSGGFAHAFRSLRIRDYRNYWLSGLGMTGLGGSNNLPNNKVSDTLQFVDNLTFLRGNHSFKAGIDIRHDLSDILGAQSATGTFQFNGRYTGIGLGDAFLGWINQATLGTTIDSDMRFDSWMGYFQVED